MTYEKIVIPMDHGNCNMKTKEEVFTSGLVENDMKPGLGDYLMYNGKYYSLTGKRIPFMKDKTREERFFILTLFGIGKELEKRSKQKDVIYQVELLVGLPLKHYGALYKKFEKFFIRQGIIRFTYNMREYMVQIMDTVVFPQDYAATMTIYPQIASRNRVVAIDIGGFTVDYLLLRGGKPDLYQCDSLEMGVITLYNRIISKANSELDILLDEKEIDMIICDKSSGYDGKVIKLVQQMTKQYVDDLLAIFRERGIELKTGCIVFSGGGSKLLKSYLENTDKIRKCEFVDDICANARGYEILYQMKKKDKITKGKKNPYVMTIGFRKNNAEHIWVAEFLNSLERKKAQYIVKAIRAYQYMEEHGEVPPEIRS